MNVTPENHTELSREPEHSFTRQLKSKPSVRARLRQAFCRCENLRLHMTESNLANVRNWLLNRTTMIEWIDHQDGVWCLSSAFPSSVLIELYKTPNALPDRRDQILYAIAVHLEMLLTPGESCDDQTENERELTISFAHENWDDILRIDREMGLSGDFDSHVVPVMTDRG